MRKDKQGRIANYARRKAISDLRKKNYSYSEIAIALGIGRSLVNYYINSKLKNMAVDNPGA